MSWKQKNLNKLNKRLLANQKKRKPKGISTIGVLCQGQDQSTIKRALEAVFNIDASDVWLMDFVEKNKHTLEDDHWFSELDFSMFGRLKYNKLDDFVKKDFDLLINYQNQPSVFLNHVNLQSNAGFKVGLIDAHLDGLDMEVRECNNDIDLFNSEIIKYLKILKIV
ncbi:hypothetical protein N9L20_00235 [Flavobacteriaceae bacterium]|nr:hypothetical protein [Flavobacteriaceae bacterium]